MGCSEASGPLSGPCLQGALHPCHTKPDMGSASCVSSARPSCMCSKARAMSLYGHGTGGNNIADPPSVGLELGPAAHSVVPMERDSMLSCRLKAVSSNDSRAQRRNPMPLGRRCELRKHTRRAPAHVTSAAGGECMGSPHHALEADAPLVVFLPAALEVLSINGGYAAHTYTQTACCGLYSRCV